MKGKKCFGLLLLFFIMVGLSLNVSSDTSALKYNIGSFPLYQTHYPEFSGPGGSNFAFYFDTRLDDEDDLVFNSDLSSLDHSFYYKRYSDCSYYDSKSHIFSVFDNPNNHHYKSIWSGGGTGFERGFAGYSVCRNNIEFLSYDSFFANQVSISTGDVINTVNIDRELFGFDTEPHTRHVSMIKLPLRFKDDVSFSANSPLSFSLGFVTGYWQGFTDFTTPTIDFTLYYSDSSANPLSHTFTTSECSIDTDYGFLTINDDLSVNSAFNGFLVTCSFTPSTDVRHLVGQFNLYSGNSADPSSFFSYHSFSGLFFSATYVVSDNDDSWSGVDVAPTPSGEDISYSPGYVSLYGRNEGPGSSNCGSDFLCKLNNLFSFSFINPFQPLFTMFSNNSSCVSIPTLASMLHSNETTVCPWFSSNVRTIVTPVLSLASMMLIFGFAVRWLGARSGNFFEDSSGIDSGNLHFENKYHGGRRKK